MFVMVKLPSERSRFDRSDWCYVAASQIKLVDLCTLRPALEVIEESPDPLARYTTPSGKNYFLLSEIHQWADRHGFEFASKDEIDPLWVEYIQIHNSLERYIKRLGEVETALGEEYVTGTKIPAKRLHIDTGRERAPVEHSHAVPPLDLTAMQKLIRSQESSIERLNKELSAARLKYSEAIKKHESAMSGIDIVIKQSENDSLLLARRQKLKSPRHVNTSVSFDPDFMKPDVIEGFEECIPYSRLFQELKTACVSAYSGVYFLINDDDEVVYVGQSTNIISRIGDHLVSEKAPYFTKVAAVSVDHKDLLNVEAAYIAEYNPPLNRTTDDRRESRRAVSELKRHRSKIRRLTACSKRELAKQAKMD